MADIDEQGLQVAAAGDEAAKGLDTGQVCRYGSATRYVQDNLQTVGRLRPIEAAVARISRACGTLGGRRAPAEDLVLSLIGFHTIDLGACCCSAEDEAVIALQYPDKPMAMVYLSYNQDSFFERHYPVFDGCFVEIRDINTLLVSDEVVFNYQGATLLVANGLFKNQTLEFALSIGGVENRSALHPQGAALMRMFEAAIPSSLEGRAIQLEWDGVAHKNKLISIGTRLQLPARCA